MKTHSSPSSRGGPSPSRPTSGAACTSTPRRAGPARSSATMAGSSSRPSCPSPPSRPGSGLIAGNRWSVRSTRTSAPVALTTWTASSPFEQLDRPPSPPRREVKYQDRRPPSKPTGVACQTMSGPASEPSCGTTSTRPANAIEPTRPPPRRRRCGSSASSAGRAGR